MKDDWVEKHQETDPYSALETRLSTLEKTVSLHDRQMGQFTVDLQRIVRALFGHNGDPTDGMVTQFVLIKNQLNEITGDLKSFRAGLWAILMILIGLALTQIWQHIFNAPGQIEQILIIVTATPVP